MRKLRCFVAMAFGWDDTDAVFDLLKETFRKTLDIRRVDRINHNKDIDDKIIEELRAADFVIADLTYARPSAYWEAGYAQGRPIPVIYTARRDHIGKKATDDNRRVHFDLQMRNIVPWTTPNADFVRRLKARVGLVTRPLLIDRAAAEARQERRKKFASLSQHQRLEAITSAAIAYFKTNGFKVEYPNDERDVAMQLRQRGQRLRSAVRMDRDTLQIGTLWVLPAVKKEHLRWVRTIGPLFEHEANLNIARRPPKQIEFITFLLTLGRMSPKVLQDSFPSASCDGRMTATLSSCLMYLPNASLWKSGRAIEYYLSGFKVGKDNVKADATGTFIEKFGSSRARKTKAGKAVECQAIRRYRVISGIADPSDIPQEIDETFGCGVTLP